MVPMKYLKTNTSVFENPRDPNMPKVKNMMKPWGGGKVDTGILGVPYDYGTLLVGGRVGARNGPGAIRAELKRYGTTFNIDYETDVRTLSIADLGDVEISDGNQHETYARIEKVLAGILEKGIVPIVMGGSNDISFPDAKALSNSFGAIGGINVDAHFDVRKAVEGKVTSGSPYYMALETLGSKFSGKNFVEVGSHDNLNSREYYEYLKKKGVKVFTLGDARKSGVDGIVKKSFSFASKGTDAIFFSIDIDSVAQAFAPGCSAPDSDGFTPEQVRRMAFLAGNNPKVKLFEIMEVNPKYDIDGRTARLAASLVISFLTGHAARS